MADIERSAQAVWHGDLRGGNGQFSTNSGLVKDAPYSFKTRFEDAPGTNPEELLAAAHAACFSMAFSARLANKGYNVNEIKTRAVCVMTPQPTGGFKITKMKLETRGKVEGVDAATFKEIAEDAKKNCPVSGALSALAIELDAALA